MIDRQDLFNKAYLGLQSQGFKQSLQIRTEYGEPEYMCLYRGPNGLKCAVGWIIPDGKYRKSMENNCASHVLKLTEFEDVDWANRLQQVHDNAKGPYHMKDSLKLFADSYNLTIPPLPVAA